MFAELLGDVPSSTHPQRFIVMIFKETSLLLSLAAAQLAGRPRRREMRCRVGQGERCPLRRGPLALLTAYTQGSAPTPGCDVRIAQDTGVAAVVAFYPPTDLARLSSLGYLGGMDRFLGGTQDAVPERYRLLSPVSRVDPYDPPTFVAHGGDDQIVPPGQSELLAERLREAGVPRRLVELPWANHTFDFLWDGWGSQITRSTLQEFLEVHLETPNGARDDPSRPVPDE